VHDADGMAGGIMHNVDRIEHLVRTLLTYAADPAEHQSSADLGAVLRDAVLRFTPELQAQGKLVQLQIDDDVGSVATDPVVLAQVFNSLLSNALEATQAGAQVRVGARRVGVQAHIEFHDNGSGIEAEQLHSIFQPFFTTKPRGLGLGLPLARRIVQRLGGQIAVESTPGQGTRIRLQVPLLRGLS